VPTIAHHEADVVVVCSPHHLGASVDWLLDTLAELQPHGVQVAIHDQADDRATVETGGLLAAAA
jgi:hypothetical protein